MQKKKILLFAGTSEGRELAESLIQMPVELHVCVATEYGRMLLPKAENLTISADRMDQCQMTDFMARKAFELVLDATHPYALEVSQNIKAACNENQIPYERILRNLDSKKAGQLNSPEIYASDIEEAKAVLDNMEGPVFLTTGSKNLSDFMHIKNAGERIFVRILPNPEMLLAAGELGLKAAHIICMQGPFDTDMNIATMEMIQRRWHKEHPENKDSLVMVTKQSGPRGGFDEKLSAAERLSVTSLLIGKPEESQGLSISQAIAMIAGETAYTPKRKVTLIGMGMSEKQLTLEADQAIRESDLLVGAKRMLEMAKSYQKPVYCSYKYDEIAAYLMAHVEYQKIAVLFSGDIGFYSGAPKMRQALLDLPFEIHAISGISSPIHFLNSIGKTWENVKFLSCHGMESSIISHLRLNRRVAALLGSPKDVSNICYQLIAYHMPDTKVYVGSNLQQANESVSFGLPADFLYKEYPALSVIYLERPFTEEAMTHGLADEAFIRGKVPTTKSEIRSIAISKLGLTTDSILYDIGAGTGSIAIEAARMLPYGHVFAIEKNPEGIELIIKNAAALQADNLSIVRGHAPEALEDLPSPSHAFIGGSSGELEAIILLLKKKNPSVRVVITAITLETIASVMELVRKEVISDPEIIQVQVNGTKKAGPYHLMQGQNPIYIISF